MAIYARASHLLLFVVFVMAFLVNSEADENLGDVDSGLSAIDGINNDEVCTQHGFRVPCSMPAPAGDRLRALLPLPCLTLRFCPG